MADALPTAGSAAQVPPQPTVGEALAELELLDEGTAAVVADIARGPSVAERRRQEIAATLAAAGVTAAGPDQLTVVLDPGHGGSDSGAAMNGVAELSSNLDFALRVEEILLANGLHVVLTRRDAGTSLLVPDVGGSGRSSARRDRQARAELAAFLDADVFVSIHSNGHPDPSVNGVEVWYHPSVLAAGENQRLGALILGRVLAELHASGYPGRSLGVKDDTCWRRFGRGCRSIYVLSPPITLTREGLEARGYDPAAAGFRPDQAFRSTRGTWMPAILVELLFTSNPEDAAALRNGALRQAMARGVAQGILELLRS